MWTARHDTGVGADEIQTFSWRVLVEADCRLHPLANPDHAVLHRDGPAGGHRRKLVSAHRRGVRKPTRELVAPECRNPGSVVSGVGEPLELPGWAAHVCGGADQDSIGACESVPPRIRNFTILLDAHQLAPSAN